MGGDDWFQKACQSGVRCDQLVISGHFAGDFFGDSGKTLSLKEMEEAGCSKTCESIMNQPLEIFLFGCNTLAEKDLDHRTPQQYLQVLLDDGIPRVEAEMVVESRYGAVGDSNRASMQRAFSGFPKQIYGFNSVGPSGKNVKGFLNNYFTKVSAPDQLEKQSVKRAMNQVEMGNKILAEALKPTAFAQCASVDSEDEKTKKVCGLLDKGKSNAEKLDLTIELLAQEDYLSYLPHINSFIRNLDVASLSPEDKKSFDMIKENQVVKGQLLSLIDQTSGLGLKAEWVQLAQTLGFLSMDEAKEKMTADIHKLFKKPLTDNDANLICNLDYSIKPFLELKESKISYKKIGPNEMMAYSCLAPIEDPELLNRIVLTPSIGGYENLLNEQIYIAEQSLSSGYIPPQEFLNRVKSGLSSKDLYLKSDSLGFMAQITPDDPQIKSIATDLIKDSTVESDYIYFGVVALEKANIFDAGVAQELMNTVLVKGIPDYTGISYIVKTKPTSPEMVEGMGKILSGANTTEDNKLEILDYIAELKPAQEDVYLEMIKYAKNVESTHRERAIEILKKSALSAELKQLVDGLK